MHLGLVMQLSLLIAAIQHMSYLTAIAPQLSQLLTQPNIILMQAMWFKFKIFRWQLKRFASKVQILIKGYNSFSKPLMSQLSVELLKSFYSRLQPWQLHKQFKFQMIQSNLLLLPQILTISHQSLVKRYTTLMNRHIQTLSWWLWQTPILSVQRLFLWQMLAHINLTSRHILRVRVPTVHVILCRERWL